MAAGKSLLGLQMALVEVVLQNRKGKEVVWGGKLEEAVSEEELYCDVELGSAAEKNLKVEFRMEHSELGK